MSDGTFSLAIILDRRVTRTNFNSENNMSCGLRVPVKMKATVSTGTVDMMSIKNRD
jgi:CRISPR/Cas system type I-B associated protein Csh2 (Cas7 group RAMP superfamily)